MGKEGEDEKERGGKTGYVERRIGEQSEVILLYKYTEDFHHSLCLPKSLMFITGKAQSENIK